MRARDLYGFYIPPFPVITRSSTRWTNVDGRVKYWVR